MKANLAAIIERFRKHSMPVLLVGISALTNFNERYRDQFDPIFRELADQFDIPLFPDILSCYFHSPAMKLLDQMHPNADGVTAIAKGLHPLITSMIRTA